MKKPPSAALVAQRANSRFNMSIDDLTETLPLARKECSRRPMSDAVTPSWRPVKLSRRSWRLSCIGQAERLRNRLKEGLRRERLAQELEATELRRAAVQRRVEGSAHQDRRKVQAARR